MSFKFVFSVVTIGLAVSAPAVAAPSEASTRVVRDTLTGQVTTQTAREVAAPAPIGLPAGAHVLRDNLTGQITVNMPTKHTVELARDSRLRVMRDNLTGQILLSQETAAAATVSQL